MAEVETISYVQEEIAIPDSVLQELEKISKLEKNDDLLFERTAVMYGDISDIKQTLSDNDIVDQGDEKNVINKSKTKSYLTSVEKKRYAAIGQQFSKGIAPYLKQIKKAQQMKQKMSTKQNPWMKKLKGFLKSSAQNLKNKVKSGFKSLLKKLWNAVLVLGVVMFIFKDKLEKVFSGISIRQGSAADLLINGSANLLDKIYNFLYDGINSILTNVFSDNFTNGVKKLFTETLPNLIQTTGYSVMSFLSDEITEEATRRAKQLQGHENQLNEVQRRVVGINGSNILNSALKSNDVAQIQEAQRKSSSILLQQEVKKALYEQLKKGGFFTNVNQLQNVANKQNAKLNEELIERQKRRLFDDLYQTNELLKILEKEKVFAEGSDENIQKERLSQVLNKYYGFTSDENKPFNTNSLTTEQLKSLRESYNKFVEYNKDANKIVDGLEQQSDVEIQKEVKLTKVGQMEFSAEVGSGIFVESLNKLDEAMRFLTESPIDFIKSYSSNLFNFLYHFITGAWNDIYEIARGIVDKFNSQVRNETKNETYNTIINATLKTMKNVGGGVGNIQVRGSQNSTQYIHRPVALISFEMTGSVVNLVHGFQSSLTHVVQKSIENNNRLNNIVNRIKEIKNPINENKNTGGHRPAPVNNGDNDKGKSVVVQQTKQGADNVKNVVQHTGVEERVNGLENVVQQHNGTISVMNVKIDEMQKNIQNIKKTFQNENFVSQSSYTLQQGLLNGYVY